MWYLISLNKGYAEEINHCSSKFKMLNFYLTLIKINEWIDVEKYFNHIISLVLIQNLNSVSFVCNDKNITFIINNNILYSADELVNNNIYDYEVRVFNHFAIVYIIINQINFIFNQPDSGLKIPLLEFKYEVKFIN